jgi:2-dehydro-3-deoxy-D-arabinonate dehydratase
MHLYRTQSGPVLHANDAWFHVDRAWDELINDDSLAATLAAFASSQPADASLGALTKSPLAPIGAQEVWAAGVTYLRSKTARMEESQSAGGGDFYDRVYQAERPEIFFKATPHRVTAPGQSMHLRRDSKWIVPEPELTLVVTRRGTIVGYTIGNDLSCRDIEGENPLYLPQAKTFDRCAAVGPAILVAEGPLPSETAIRVTIQRAGKDVFRGSTSLAQMKRTAEELVGFLFRDNSHPQGCLLMTGTGIVPPDDFSLRAGDVVEITIDGIGTLSNPME